MIDKTKCDHYLNGYCKTETLCSKTHPYRECNKILNCYYERLEKLTLTYDTVKQENAELKNKLEKVKPIIEYYANSKLGTLQADGTYKLDYNSNMSTGSFDMPDKLYCVPNTITYDPRPAIEALKIMEEK